MTSEMQKPPTAKNFNLMHCHICQNLIQYMQHQNEINCPRCGEAAHLRLPNSLNHTWVFLITSIILYIPANTLPIMTVTKLGEGDAHTIVGGIIALLHSGMFPIAIIVFIASLLVPFLKMLGIALLLISVQRDWQVNPGYRTTMYRIIEFVGRWSMLDIFMISILVAMVDLGGVAKVYAGAGATAFAAVVIFTMLAAISFDSRLIWDKMR